MSKPSILRKALVSRKVRIAFGVAMTPVLLGLGALRSAIVVLGLSVAAYLCSNQLFGIDPLTMREAADWFEDQDDSSAQFVVTTAISVFGVLFAVWAASFTWRRSKRTELRLAAAVKVNSFFQSLTLSINDLAIYAGQLDELHQICQSDCELGKAQSFARYLRRLQPKIDAAQKSLWSKSIEVHALRVELGALLIERWYLNLSFRMAEQQVQLLTERLYPMPPWAIEDHEFLGWVSGSDPLPWRKFQSQVELSREKMLAATGAMKGRWEGDIVRPGVSLIVEMWRLLLQR